MSKKRNEGFTLVELLVTIVVASIVTMAASTVLLLGMRLNNSSSATAQRQNTVRIFMSVVENMASEGDISAVTKDGDSWQIKDSDGNTLFHYDHAAKTIYAGGTPMMEGLNGSSASMDEEIRLLTVTVETKDGTYTASVYCRVIAPSEQPTRFSVAKAKSVMVGTEDGTYTTVAYCSTDAFLKQSSNVSPADAEEMLKQNGTLGWASMLGVADQGRLEFLEALYSQLGSTGTIQGDYPDAGMSYAQWYNESWSEDTPWCGCFLSWGLEQVAVRIQISTHDWYLRFATMENCEAFFKKLDENNEDSWMEASKSPMPGDIIFFDWNGDQKPNHVGAVLAVKDGYVYTIEGNSADMVVVGEYPVGDARILGYGVLNWKD